MQCVLNVTDNTIKVTGYSSRSLAADVVNDIEKQKRDDLDAVLVWVRSVRDVKTAYPNYYADTGAFLSALHQALRLDRHNTV
jgi:putative GTP pyrophosphokinase